MKPSGTTVLLRCWRSFFSLCGQAKSFVSDSWLFSRPLNRESSESETSALGSSVWAAEDEPATACCTSLHKLSRDTTTNYNEEGPQTTAAAAAETSASTGSLDWITQVYIALWWPTGVSSCMWWKYFLRFFISCCVPIERCWQKLKGSLQYLEFRVSVCSSCFHLHYTFF